MIPYSSRPSSLLLAVVTQNSVVVPRAHPHARHRQLTGATRNMHTATPSRSPSWPKPREAAGLWSDVRCCPEVTPCARRETGWVSTRNSRTRRPGALPRQTSAATNRSSLLESGVVVSGLMVEKLPAQSPTIFRRLQICQRLLKARTPRHFQVLLQTTG
ncbi:hypothetical protein EJ06DRAFT_174837 [Trichodelitschia bisporula]|uniref:Uncharacterized protein n=1 Tax=Trichodelitschia bisporula TaxID=703511 RepID=A0A6G1HLE7_9PEZI|nr:hypothetical protein EJ06DRAFT_174837 [Trichodelitschia bisporula]